MEPDMPSWVTSLLSPHILSIPPYVPGKPIAELQRELGIEHAIKLASNENPLGPSPMAVDAIKAELGRAHVYPESSAPDLRKAIAARFGLSPGSVILGNGSDEIMQMAAHLFVQPGCEAVMGSNTFSMYRIVVEAFGGTAIRVPLKDHCFDLEAMAEAVTDRTRMVFLTVPNSPTGTLLSRGELDSFMAKLGDRRLLVILDEAYREYVDDADCPAGCDYMDGPLPVLVLRTFSKIYGLAGLRVGYGLAKPWLIELLNRVRPPFNVNSLAQVAAVAALADLEHVESTRRLTRDGISYLSRELAALELEVIPSQANFVTFCADGEAGRIYEALLREGVIVRHLASFGMPACIRVTVGTDTQNRRFVAALKRVMGL